MNIIEIVLISISLAMDAFTISICKGMKNHKLLDGFIISIFFGIFQWIMPILGYYFGIILSDKIINYNYYLSAILLISIGILMLKEEKITELDNRLNYKELFILSIATSIDALVIGISFSFLKVNIFSSSLIIGIITTIISFIGYYLGNLLNKKVGKYSNFIGGLTLIILGIKILIETII